MDYSAAQKRIDDLKSQINYHSNRYYNMDDPEISDYEYDMMMNELKQLEKEFPELVTADSPTQHVGGQALLNLFEKVTHTVQMGSLQDVFDRSELIGFAQRCQEKCQSRICCRTKNRRFIGVIRVSRRCFGTGIYTRRRIYRRRCNR